MITALCISGLPRHVEKNVENIRKNLVEPNNPDIFIHTWVPIDYLAAADVIEEIYQPKLMYFEPQLPFINSRWNLDRMMEPTAGHARSYQRHKFVEMLYSSWYSVQQANWLKEKYQREHDFTYDCVIRARFDIDYNKPVDCSQFAISEQIFIPEKGLPPEMTDDRFAFGSSDLMNAYCSAFNLLDFVHKKRHLLDGIFCGETLVYEMLKMYGITAKPVEGLNCGHIH